MARAAHTYRAARRLVAKMAKRRIGGTVSSRMQSTVFSPVPNRLRLTLEAGKTYSGGNYPGSVRRELQKLGLR